MYWVWARGPTAANETFVYGPPLVTERLHVDFDTGGFVATGVPLVEISRDERSKGVLTDCVFLRGGGGLLFSSRLRKVLAAIPLDNVQYFPALVRNEVAGTATDDYALANIVGRISCLDQERSVLELAPDDADVIESIEVLAIDEGRACSLDLFRLHEEPQVVIASERVREACERHRISGVHFYEPRAYPP